jgi:hypothetical protein
MLETLVFLMLVNVLMHFSLRTQLSVIAKYLGEIRDATKNTQPEKRWLGDPVEDANIHGMLLQIRNAVKNTK